MPSNVAGYLQPTNGPILEGEALENFVQGWLVGLSGLDGTLVRPAYQPEPANAPETAVVWLAFSFEDVDDDTFPSIVHDGSDDGSDQMRRNERFDVLCSVYGLGANSEARQCTKLIRDNTSIPQNLEPLFLAGMGLVEVFNPVRVPSLLAERWRYRMDLRIRLSRVILRDYEVLNILRSQGTVTSNTTSNFDTENEKP